MTFFVFTDVGKRRPFRLAVTQAFIDDLLLRYPLAATGDYEARLEEGVFVPHFNEADELSPIVRVKYSEVGKHAEGPGISANRKRNFARILMNQGFVIVQDDDFFCEAKSVWQEQGFQTQADFLNAVATLLRQNNYLKKGAVKIFQDRRDKSSEGQRLQLGLQAAVEIAQGEADHDSRFTFFGIYMFFPCITSNIHLIQAAIRNWDRK
jgi:hypothetical protein